STMYKSLAKEVDTALNSRTPTALTTPSLDDMPENSFLHSLWLTMKWSMTLRLRAKAQLGAKIVTNVVMGCFYGALFYQLDLDSWYLKAMLLFQLPTFTLSTLFPQVQVLSAQKKIFLKHIDSKFYSP